MWYIIHVIHMIRASWFVIHDMHSDSVCVWMSLTIPACVCLFFHGQFIQRGTMTMQNYLVTKATSSILILQTR